MVNEYTQTISAIINERRGINPALSIKLGQQLGTKEDYFMLLQASYEVQKEINKSTENSSTPNLSNIRKVLFWDTNFDQIDWNRNKSAIIRRVFERGNDNEIEEIISFYGRPTVRRVIRSSKNEFLPAYNKNAAKHLQLSHQ